GFNAWVDREGIRGGTSWRREVVTAIESADACVIALSTNSVRSENVQRELVIAQESKKEIIPVEVEITAIPSEIKYQLAGLHRIDMTADFETGMSKLVNALNAMRKANDTFLRPKARRSSLGEFEVTDKPEAKPLYSPLFGP